MKNSVRSSSCCGKRLIESRRGRQVYEKKDGILVNGKEEAKVVWNECFQCPMYKSTGGKAIILSMVI